MKRLLPLAALATAAPLAASEPAPDRAAVTAAVDAFFTALRSPDRTALARQMDLRGMIYVHDRQNPAAPRVMVIPVADHLARWARGTASVDEVMRYDTVLVDGDMAQVWGPYRFISDGRTSHCGINSMSLVRGEGGVWKVANTSFSMVAPAECAAIGAPEEPAR